MLVSLGIIFVGGVIGVKVCEKFKLPSLVAYIILGIIIGPYVLNIIDDTLLSISTVLRKIALIIILLRAGLTLDIDDLKNMGLPALLMSFVPAMCEIVTVMVVGCMMFKRSALEMSVIGCILAAVSPAVVVPRMIKLIEEHKGEKHRIPQLVLASASLDDIFVILLFTITLNILNSSAVFQFIDILKLPVMIICGILIGVASGYILNYIFKRISLNNEYKVILLFALSFIFVYLEDDLHLMMSSLLAVMSMGIMLRTLNKDVASSLNSSYNALWKCAELLLFTLVGAMLDISYAFKFGSIVIVFVCICLVGRMLGVAICIHNTNFSNKEKLFTMIAYTPKATVQAAIGTIPLSHGLAIGDLALTIAVVAILLTAPIGALCIDRLSDVLLD